MKKGSKIMGSLPLLYFLFVLMLVELSYLMHKEDNQSIFVFAIIVFISYLVNSNMIFVLGISLISINLLKYFRGSLFEGMENDDTDSSHTENPRRNCKDFKETVIKNIDNVLSDSSNNDIPNNAFFYCKKIKKQYIDAETDYDFYEYYKDNFNNITDRLSINWINKNIYKSTDFEYISCNLNTTKRNLPEHIEKELKDSNKLITSYNKEYFKDNIEDDTEDPNHINNVMDRLKTNTPELVDSLKILNTIDINQVNSLINNLNSLAGSFKK